MITITMPESATEIAWGETCKTDYSSSKSQGRET